MDSIYSYVSWKINSEMKYGTVSIADLRSLLFCKYHLIENSRDFHLVIFVCRCACCLWPFVLDLFVFFSFLVSEGSLQFFLLLFFSSSFTYFALFAFALGPFSWFLLYLGCSLVLVVFCFLVFLVVFFGLVVFFSRLFWSW